MASTHPHFDDKGAVAWRTEFAPALREARDAGQRLLIEFGREQCSQCRALVQSVVPRPEIAELLNEHFVCLAADCDEPEDEVEELAGKLEGATMLPFVLFVDASGQFLEGTSGAVDPGSFRRTLQRIAGVEAPAE